MSLRPAFLTSAAVLLALAACGSEQEEGSATMRPGENCLASGCHGDFTAAGTVYATATAAAGEGVGGVVVRIVGPNGTAEVTTNGAGNFYTSANTGYPAAIRIGGTLVMAAASHGGCAACHGSTFRVTVP